MDISIFLARAIGLLGVITSLAVLTRYKEALAYEERLVKHVENIYLSGFFILILGVLLVVGHQVWTSDWRVIITILGWLVLLKGIFRVSFPGTVKRLIEKKKRSRWFMAGEVVMLLISLYLLYQGFVMH